MQDPRGPKNAKKRAGEPREGAKGQQLLVLRGFFGPPGPLPDIEEGKGHAQGTLGAAHLAGEGSLAGDKRGYKYPLGGIWKEKREHLLRI